LYSLQELREQQIIELESELKKQNTDNLKVKAILELLKNTNTQPERAGAYNVVIGEQQEIFDTAQEKIDNLKSRLNKFQNKKEQQLQSPESVNEFDGKIISEQVLTRAIEKRYPVSLISDGVVNNDTNNNLAKDRYLRFVDNVLYRFVFTILILVEKPLVYKYTTLQHKYAGVTLLFERLSDLIYSIDKYDYIDLTKITPKELKQIFLDIGDNKMSLYEEYRKDNKSDNTCIGRTALQRVIKEAKKIDENQ
jgi:hypothetical protein